jgi:hypothetical protein
MKAKLHALTSMIATAFVATSTASASMIAHFKFDNAGSIGADSSGLANHADSLNYVGFTATGISGGAAALTASPGTYLRWAGTFLIPRQSESASAVLALLRASPDFSFPNASGQRSMGSP